MMRDPLWFRIMMFVYGVLLLAMAIWRGWGTTWIVLCTLIATLWLVQVFQPSTRKR